MSDFRIKTCVLGPVSTNCYLVYNDTTKEAVAVDPGDNGDYILNKCSELGIKLQTVLLTHGHFDHVGAALQYMTGMSWSFWDISGKSLQLPAIPQALCAIICRKKRCFCLEILCSRIPMDGQICRQEAAERWWILYLGSCLYCREILWSIRAMESPLPLVMRRRTILLHAIDRK